MYGDQEKYYRQLYGRRKNNVNNPTTLFYDNPDTTRQGAQITELTDDFFQDNVSEQIEPAPDEKETNKEWFGAESEPIYGFDKTWHKDQRRQPIQNYEGLNDMFTSNFDSDSIKQILNSLPPDKSEIIDSNEVIHKNGDVFGKSSKLVCKTKKGAVVTEETEISTDGKSMANLRFQRSTVKTGPNKVKEVLQSVKEDAVLDECARKKCVGDTLTTKTTTLVTVSQTMETSCNE